MSRIRSAGSLFWGFVLLAAGGLLLARNLGYPIPLWSGIARYWPVVLIFWGLFKMVDYFRYKNSDGNRALFSAGEIVMLILVILAGSAITIAANISPNIDDIFKVANIDIWDITGNSYEFTEHHEMEAQPDATIEISNRFGAVDVSPADTNSIVVDVKKTVLASSTDEANKIAQGFSFSINHDSPTYRIVGAFTGSQNNGRRVRTALTIRVPKRSVVKLDNRNGAVSVTGLTGNQTINSSFAGAVVHNIEGNVDVQNRNGTVEVHGIKGNATIVNSFANVDVRDVSGTLDLRTRNGNVDVTDIGGAAKIENAFANTSAKNVGGDLDVENRNGNVEIDSVKGMATVANQFAYVRATNVARDLRVHVRNGTVEIDHAGSDVNVESSFNNVSIRDAKGAVSVTNRNGDVSVRLAEAPTKDISLSTEFSSVELDLPASSSFNMDARTRFGQIHSSFDGLNTNSQNAERTITGHVGQGGPNIKLDTRNGDIRLGRY
jgi:hypothetical protein